MFAFFGSNNRHGTPHHETIKWFQSEAYCRIHVYEKPTGITGWLLGLAAFRELLLYKQLRNPFAHALGVLRSGAYQLEIKKVLSRNAATPGDGLTQAEVTALEESPQRPGGIPPGVQGSGNQWESIVDFLYRDVLDMMVGLAHDTTQMQQAEARFQAGTYVWRP